MEHSKSSDEVREVFRTGYLRKMTLATLLMIVMVGSGFLVSVARAETAPSIWTDKDSYLVGETVMIQGQGFLPGLVSLTVSHPDLGELNYVSAVGADGTFVCEDYVSAAVENASIPLTVVAMQDEMHHAQTQFYDPAGHSKLEGWTLHPGAPHWTDGDVKGYNEGDVVPVQIVFTSGNDPGFLASLGTITGRIAFEYGYGFLPTPEIRGFKEVDRYTWDGLNPSPPYNNPAPSATPFSGVGGIVIVNQVREPLLQDGFRVWDVWDITCYFTSDHAALRAAGQLAMTTGPQKGASFFPGSSLHVKLMNTDPKFPHDGTESLPVIVGIITPPEIELEKFCLPDKLAIGDQVTFEIAAANTGQGDAVLLSLFDCMYGGLLYVDDSTQVWTSADSTKVPFDDPIFVGGDPHRLMWCLDHIVIPGTACAQDPNNRISVWYLSFRAQLVNDECQGDTDNHAILWYTDDHCGEPRYACAECDFEIIHPQLGVDKWSDMTCAAGIYRVVDDQYWPGDVVTYWINVSNPLCSNDIMHFKAYDAILAVELGLPSSDPIMTGCLLPGQYVNESFDYRVTGAEPQPRETNCMFRNTVDVIGWDDFGHKVTPSAYWDIKIYHPNLKVEKEADRDLASKNPAETIHYTVTVTNLGDVALQYVLKDRIDALPQVIIGSGTLQPAGHLGDSEHWHFDFTPNENTPCGDLRDVATAYAEDVQEHRLQRSDSECVKIVVPQIHVTKTCLDPVTLLPTDIIGLSHQLVYKIDTYVPNTPCATPLWFNETDTLPLQPFTNEEPPLGAPLPVVQPGDPLEVPPDYLLPGQHDIDYYLYTLRPQDIDQDGVVTNTVHVWGWWNSEHPENYVHDQDSCSATATSKVFGYVYYDKDLDDGGGAAKDVDDGPGLPSWTVVLEDEHGVPVPGFFPLLTQGGLNAGYYEFDNVLPGKYMVRSFIQSGWFSTKNLSVIKADSTVFTLLGGSSHEEDFGNALFGSISGTKYYDWNLGCTWDDSEIGIDGWHITLTGTTYFQEPVGPITIETGLGPTPDGHGYWEFTDLYPGIYVVTEEDRDGWAHICPADGRYINQQIDETDDGATHITCCKFGNVPLATICGHKYYDKDLSRTWNDDEPGLAGWTILLQNNSIQWPGIWKTYATTTTDANGLYRFTGVKPNPGMYRITEVKKSPEWVMTTDPSTLLINLQKPLDKTSIVGKNIGNVLLARVEGVKFQDWKGDDGSWPNGVQNGQEPGLPSWTITLQGRTITGQLVSLSTFTQGPPSTVGYYNFSVLPGTYWVNETEKNGWTPTTPISNMIIVVAYPPAQVKVRVNFGNTLLNFDPELPFVLQKGTNLWSTPMTVSGLSAKSLLAAIGPSATSVTKINKATGKLQSFMPNFPVALDFPLVPGEGCYVVVKQTVQFTLMGDLVGPTTTQLVAGTNLIGFPSSTLSIVKASTLLGMVSGCHGKSITYLDATSGKLRSYMPGFPSALDFDVVPGLGYYLTTDGAGTLTVA